MRLNKQKLIISILAVIFFISTTTAALAKDEKVKDEELLKAEDGLKSLSKKLREDYSEMDGYLDTLLLAVLTEQHVLSLGGPGGSKTKTAKDVLDVLKGKLFNLQFSPNTKQEKIIGAIKGKEFLESGKIEYQTDQSLLHHDYAILDEIDKANTEVLASALSVLLERKAMVGDKEIKGNLKTALITSNMTLHEFLEKFRNTNDGSTGMALLDRILFKVLVVNRLSSAESLFKVMNNCQKEKGGVCPLLKELDLHVLKEQISKVKVPEEVMKLSAHLWMRLGAALEKKQLDDQLACSEDPKSMPFPYTMTNQFTTRGAVGSLVEVMRAAKYLELLKNNKDTKNVCLSPIDLIYANSQMIMQGPDKLEPGTPQNPNMCPSGKLLEKIKNQYQHNPRTLKMIEDLEFERKTFARIYLEVLKIYQEELSALGSQALMKKISLGGGDVSTLSQKDKKEIYLKITEIRNAIEEKRKKEFANSEALDGEGVGVMEIARTKVLQELNELEQMLEVSKKIEQETNERIEKERLEKEKIEKERERELAQKISEIGITFTKHDNGPAVFSLDGETILTGLLNLGKNRLFNPDSMRRRFSQKEDTSTRPTLVDANNGKELHKFHKRGGDSTFDTIFSPTGKMVLVYHEPLSSWHSNLRPSLCPIEVWDAKNGGMIFSADELDMIEFSPDDKMQLLVKRLENNYTMKNELWVSLMDIKDKVDRKIVDIKFPEIPLPVFKHPLQKQMYMRKNKSKESTISFVGFTPDSKNIFITREGEKFSGLFDVSDGELIVEFKRPPTNTNTINAPLAELSSDGKTIFTTLSDEQLSLWYKKIGDKVPYLTIDEYTQVSSDRKTILIPSSDFVEVHIVGGVGSEHKIFKHKIVTRKDDVILNPNGKTIFTKNDSKIWDVESGRQLARLEKEDEDYFWEHKFSGDGSKILAISGKKDVVVFDANNGKILRKHKLESEVASVAFSPDGKKYLATLNDKRVRVWKIVFGK
ncbi:MAG: AAA family ATPase [Oligoflexia bacterium]|nr:AAA family ATPase [Oligoflexia bacterium]